MPGVEHEDDYAANGRRSPAPAAQMNDMLVPRTTSVTHRVDWLSDPMPIPTTYGGRRDL